MNTSFKKLLLLPVLLLAISCNTPAGNDNTTVDIKTTLGDIKIKLYDGTPMHRDNFIKLVKSGFYEGVSFHRVIKDFMIQGGDGATKTGSVSLPDSMNTYMVPAEFTPLYFHKKGALAAAREGNDVNPEMKSSGTQFYIVQGTKYTDANLTAAEQRINNNIKQSLFNKIIRQTADSIRLTGKTATDAEVQEIASTKMFRFLANNTEYKISDEQREVYKTIGGVPRLDATYTVFGEVTEGLDVVDRIATVATDNRDKPLTDVKILKMKIVNK